MTNPTRRTSLGLIAAGLATPALSLDKSLYLDGQGLAIRGYDAVAFFEQDIALRGSIEHELETEEGLWRFARRDHLEKFRKDPDRYMPQFGGFCAQGVARGFKRPSDPTLWVMVGGKLYMHYSIPDQNLWAIDIRASIRRGEDNWVALRDQYL